MKTRLSKKYFPFSPGVQWNIENDRYIVPKMSISSWEEAVSEKDSLHIVNFGGLLESFVSLSVVEALSKMEGRENIFWIGDERFYDLVKFQGLIKKSKIKMNREILLNYPTPLFFDKKNRAFFNLLNNYITKYAYHGSGYKSALEPLVEQIFQNCMLDWDIHYLPKMRKIEDIKLKSKVILLIMKDKRSMHHNEMLGWNVKQIKEFGNLFVGTGYKVVVATNNPYELYGSKLEIVDNDLNTIFSYLVNASCVLSSCIDWLLIAMMTKDCRAKIIGKKPYEKPFSLVYNHGFIGAENVVIENDNYLSPIEVLEIMKRG